MSNTYLPPLPPPDARGPEVCAVIRLYMAVIDDLSPQEAAVVRAHAQICEECAREARLLNLVTHSVAQMQESTPSARVDAAVIEAITARRQQHLATSTIPQPITPLRTRRRRYAGRSTWWVLAAVLLVAVGTVVSLFSGLLGSQSNTAFALPANLSWQPYVLYHSQTMTASNHEQYQVETYHNMAEHVLHVQTVMDGKLDVVVMRDNQKTLGLDMMHHVAQWNVSGWESDESMFDLPHLRQELQNGSAVYVGKSQFKGQPVYRIRCSNGQILLLDMHYMPVNVATPGNNKTLYTTLEWLHPSQVSSSLWNMNVPQGFTMGTLPAKP